MSNKRIMMWTWIASLSIVIFLLWGGSAFHSLADRASKLDDENSNLEQEIKQLKERLRVCNVNMSSICHAGAEYQGEVKYIDCGESFIKRWATCLCTTMCLEDFTVTITNRTRCRNWSSAPFQIRPEPEDEEDEEDEEEN